jgi:hypothetical protein
MERTVADVSAHPFIRFLQMFLKRQVPISLNKGLERVNWRDFVGFKIKSDWMHVSAEIDRATWKNAVAENMSIALSSYLHMKYLRVLNPIILRNRPIYFPAVTVL